MSRGPTGWPWCSTTQPSGEFSAVHWWPSKAHRGDLQPRGVADRVVGDSPAAGLDVGRSTGERDAHGVARPTSDRDARRTRRATSSATASVRPPLVGIDPAAERGRAVAAQRRGEGPGVVLVLGVRAGVGRALHPLGGLGDRHRLVAVDLDQARRRTRRSRTSGRCIWLAVPQPCEGRCWNRPTESRSP